MSNTHRSHRSVVSLVALALSLLGGTSLAATAGAADATPTTTSAAVPTLTSPSVAAGSGDAISGVGCAARVSVQIQLDGVLLVTTTSNATGGYSTRFVVPVSAKPGTRRITVVCAGANGQVSSDVPVTVSLPFTGSASGPLALVGGSCLLLGAALVVLARKRPTPALGAR